MANSAVSICSNALVKLGDDPITALSDNTNRARHANRLFHPTRQAVLRDGVWNDSIRRVKLAQLVAEPVWEFAYAYGLPADYMRMAKTSLDVDKVEYKIEGKTLLTDEGEVYIKYVFDNDDVGSYDALHVDALTARMSFELANAITGKKSLSDSAAAEYSAKLRDAKVIDGQEDFDEIFTASDLVDIRF